MVVLVTKVRDQDKPKPWLLYRRPDGSRDKLYEPGWAGELTPEEIELLQDALIRDPDLAYWWGYRPKAKRRALESIKRVAMHGDPENRSHNVKLVREANRRPSFGKLRTGSEPVEGRAKVDNENAPSRVTKSVAVSPPRLVPARSKPKGQQRIKGWESDMLEMASQGWGVKRIAQNLRDGGMEISYTTVARRLAELRGQLTLPLGS